MLKVGYSTITYGSAVIAFNSFTNIIETLVW